MSMVVPAGLREQNPRPEGVSQPKSCDFLVVGLGASAGGLQAVRKLLDVLPADTGMAFVLIQHLDPTHESMMVDLLGRDTKMRVSQAADGVVLEPNALYVIPPPRRAVHSRRRLAALRAARASWRAHAVRRLLEFLGG
jgi:two-component system, chemotaxis family, CheB/CheR fusion protein